MDTCRRLILIVDDEQDLREVFVEQVRLLGFDALEAADGSEAIELCKINEFTAIFSDLKMPKMSGLDFFAHLKLLNCTAPVIFITGFGNHDSRMSALRLGAWDFLEKPWNEKELSEIIVRASECGMRRHRLERDLSIPKAERDERTTKQIEIDKKMINLSTIMNDKKQKRM